MTEAETLRSRLSRKPIVVAPGVYDPFTALIASRAGFTSLYVSGAAIAYTKLGRPDIGLVTMTEVTDTLALIRDRVDSHLIVDADTGYGNALNVVRTVREFERAGATAIQLEDQDFPKRCGHLDGKALIPAQEMCGKIRAAVDTRRSRETLIVARTDAVAVEGFERAIERAAMYREAGADMLFVEAPRSSGDLARIDLGARPERAADGEHGRRRQDADASGGRTGNDRLFAGDLPRRHRARVRLHGERVLQFACDPRLQRAVPQPHARLHRHQRADRHARDDGARSAVRNAGATGRQEDERSPVTTLDPVTLAVLNGRLVQIADEMDATLYRSAFNPIIAEAHDACHGLYHAETGATLVQGTSGLPIFVGAMAFAVKAVIDKVGRDGGLDPGDTYLFNDPYDGGTHLNDFRLVRPLMRGGRVFAWIASVGHWLDIGGNVPGNYNPKATESFQEGVRIPPVKLIRAGVVQQDIIDILAANSRVPQSNWGDLNGQINALDLGERRLHALLDEYGDETITAALAVLSSRAEALMRANIAALPDGTYSYDDFLDNDGVIDTPLRIALDLTIAGDRMTLDFSRSAPPCDGPLNIARSTAIACCYVALKHIFIDVPANAGCLVPIEFNIPDTTLLAVSAPRPVAGYTETILRVIDVIFGAFAKAAPERAQGSPFATINALSLAGWREQRRRWIMFCFFGGGLGGNPESDGLNHSNNPISTATIPPVEILESLYPVMFTQWALRPDSGGPGRNRGGLGAIYEVEALAEAGADVFLIGERGKYPPFGVNGGGPAALNRFIYETDQGEMTPPMVSKVTDIRIRRGQKVRLETPGGGGFGDPATREPARVVRDVELGYISRESARRDYEVVLRDDGTLDAEATAKARAGTPA